MTASAEDDVPHIEPRVTLGNVLSIIGTVLSAGGILVAVAVWSGQQGQRISANEKAIAAAQAAMAGQESRIRQVEQAGARLDERLLLILDTVRDIKAKLDRETP